MEDNTHQIENTKIGGLDLKELSPSNSFFWQVSQINRRNISPEMEARKKINW